MNVASDCKVKEIDGEMDGVRGDMLVHGECWRMYVGGVRCESIGAWLGKGA